MIKRRVIGIHLKDLNESVDKKTHDVSWKPG